MSLNQNINIYKKHSILTTKFQIIYGKLQCLHLVKKNDHR